MTPRICLAVGSISAFISVAFGAFAAHGLSKTMSEGNLAIFKTGAQYQMYHALALLILGVWAGTQPISATLAGWCFTLGSVIFSGSLYALALTDVRILGAITPIGGVLFLVGWIACFIQAFQLKV
jgi:uncharacterized membrane protein YgdD (TMEM256/DUF423 family)